MTPTSEPFKTQGSEPTSPHAEGRWLWVPARKWVEDGSTHPRDVEGDPA